MPEESEGGSENTNEKVEEGLVFEEWMSDQGDDVKGMFDEHIQGLKSALVSERENRKKLEKEVRKLASDLEKGSEAEEKLGALADELGEIDRKAGFYEAAHAAGVRNLKLAYYTSVHDGLFDKRGEVDFEVMKERYPELFRSVVVPGNAGEGRGDGVPARSGMNEFIRRSAGRGGAG
jgi:hypothetical protein